MPLRTLTNPCIRTYTTISQYKEASQSLEHIKALTQWRENHKTNAVCGYCFGRPDYVSVQPVKGAPARHGYANGSPA